MVTISAHICACSGFFASLRPAIVHTRNLSALESQVVATLAGVRARIHGVHGRDTYDLYGKNRKYNLLRRLIRPLVGHYIAVSRDLQDWLIETINVAPRSGKSNL